MNTPEALVFQILQTLDAFEKMPKMYGVELETQEFVALNLWGMLESLYRNSIPDEDRVQWRWIRFTRPRYQTGSWFLSTYLGKNYEPEEAHTRLMDEIRAFRKELRMVDTHPTPTSGDQSAAFLAGVNASTEFFRQRAETYELRLAALERDKESYPEDIRETLREDMFEAMWDARHTVTSLQGIKPPESMSGPALQALRNREKMYDYQTGEARRMRDLAQKRSERLDSENKLMREMLREAYHVCIEEHAGGNLSQRIQALLNPKEPTP